MMKHEPGMARSPISDHLTHPTKEPITTGKTTSIRLSGSVEIERDDIIHPIPPGALSAVFVTLVLAEGRYISREQMIDALWDSCPRSAAVNLRGYVSRLRRELAKADGELAERLQTLKGAGGGYALRTEPAVVDLIHFARYAECGDQRRRAGDPKGAAGDYKKALGAWRGSAGLGCSGSSRLQALLATYDEQCLTVRERRAEALLDLGYTLELVPDLRDLLRTAPLRDKAWCLLLKATYLGGDLTSSMRTWNEALAASADHGLAPSGELNQIYLSILRRDDDAVRRTDSRRPQSDASR